VGLLYYPAPSARPAAPDTGARTALEADAERIASAIEAAAHGAQARADGIATTPMLRAAIETDSATLDDMSHRDLVFTLNPGEVLEVFQVKGDATTSLLRLPKAAPATAAAGTTKPAVHSDGSAVTVTVTSSIAGYQPTIGGRVALVVPVELGPLQPRIAEHALRATVMGLDRPVVVAGSNQPAGASISVPITIAPDIDVGPLSLAAELPQPAAATVGGRDPIVIARYALWGLGGLLAVVYLIGLTFGGKRQLSAPATVR